MIETKNNRLNFIFTAWFLLGALIPLFFVSAVYWSRLHKQVQQDTQRLLANAARQKISRFNSLMIYNFSLLHTISDSLEENSTVHTDASVTKELRKLALAEELAVYAVRPDGEVISAPTGVQGAIDFEWLKTASYTQPGFSLQQNGLFIIFPLSNPGYLLVRYQNADGLRQTLFEDLNDQQYFSRAALVGASSDVGKTADFFLTDEWGTVITEALFDVGGMSQPVKSEALRAWIEKSRDNELSGELDFADRATLGYARRMTVFGQKLVFVATINSNEWMNRFVSEQRESTIFYIFLLVLVLVILYVFVRSISRFLIKPIYVMITNLLSSSKTITANIGTMNESMVVQQQVSESLLKNYKAQLKNIQVVHDEIRRIVSSLNSISKQTGIAAENVALIDKLAHQSEEQSKQAETSVVTIKRLATTNDTLLASLEQYSAEIEGIAQDVAKLSEATQYLSLNAGIAAGKGSTGQGLATIVGEVGRLALVSNEASVKISELVRTIQEHLTATKSSTAHERDAASQTLTIINAALLRLKKMSRDAMNIAVSVTAINTSVSAQAGSTREIAEHSQAVTEKAQGSLKEVARLNSLVAKQASSVASNVLVARQTMNIVERLQKLIGAREKDGKKKTK